MSYNFGDAVLACSTGGADDTLRTRLAPHAQAKGRTYSRYHYSAQRRLVCSLAAAWRKVASTSDRARIGRDPDMF